MREWWLALFEKCVKIVVGLWAFVTVAPWFIIAVGFGGVLAFMADSGTAFKGRSRKKQKKSDTRDGFKCSSAPPAWTEAHEKYEGGTFRSTLDGWNIKFDSGERYVPYWWEGSNFEVDERYHGKLHLFQMECCTVSRYRGTNRSWFCPTLRFASKDDNSHSELSGYAKFDITKQRANYRFGSDPKDVAALDYSNSPVHESNYATYMYVFAKSPPNRQWVEAVSVSTHFINLVLRNSSTHTNKINPALLYTAGIAKSRACQGVTQQQVLPSIAA
jgi:hypothetical protein